MLHTRTYYLAALATAVVVATSQAADPPAVVPNPMDVVVPLPWPPEIRIPMIIVDGPVAADAVPVPPLPIVNEGFANDQDVPGPLTPLVTALRSQSFPDREAATRELLRLPPRRLTDIVNALAGESDSEAIARLTQVAAHLYLKPRTSVRTQNSFMGVWFKQTNPLATSTMVGMKFKLEPLKLRPTDTDLTMTVVVTELQPGFPAMQTLLNGDRIITLDGKGFPSDLSVDDRGYFQTRVGELWPKEIVPMTILRDGKIKDVHVQLAGMPRNGPIAIADLVDARNNELVRFLATLKTGEKSQAVLLPSH